MIDSNIDPGGTHGTHLQQESPKSKMPMVAWTLDNIMVSVSRYFIDINIDSEVRREY